MAEPPTEWSVGDCVASLRKTSLGDLIACLSGLLTFPMAFWGCDLLVGRVSTGMAACLSLLFLSVAAGVMSASRPRSPGIPPHLLAAAATRWGARVGLLVFLVGGGMFVLGTMARQASRGIAPGDYSWLTTSLAGTTGILLAALPTVALGSLAVVGRLGLSAPASGGPPPVRSGEPPPSRSRGALPFGFAVFAVGLFSLGYPALLANRQPTASAQPAAAPKAADGPGFEYDPPADLATAEAGRWRIVASRHVPDLVPGLAAVHSGDSRFLAISGQGGGLKAFDLRRGKELRSFTGLPPMSRFVWSPASDRIFCASDADPACWVLDPTLGTAVRLPVRGPIPDGQPRWTNDGEIEFFLGKDRSGRLDLGTLRSRTFPVSGSGQDSDVGNGISARLAETERAALSVRPRIRWIASPAESGSPGWDFGGGAALCVVDKTRLRVFPLLGEEIAAGTTLLVSPDVSMVTVVTPDGALTHYVGLADDAAEESVAAELPSLPDHPPDSRLGQLADSGRIGAFVCAPLTNPLTGKVIGPDPREVRALAFCVGWETGQGSLSITETYSPVQPGDVAGYLHYWSEARPIALSGGDLEEWSGKILATPPSEPGRISPSWPWPDANLASGSGGVTFLGWRGTFSDHSLPAMADALEMAEGAEPEPAAPPPQVPSSSAERKEGKWDPGTAIWAFVSGHHAKVGARDLEGFVADYAATVDFNDKGKVGADFIRRDQAAYLPKYVRLSETLVGPVRVEPVGDGWRARYTIRSFATKSDGSEFERRVAMTLDLHKDGTGRLRIVRERAAAAE
jgi:hypothetical protein